MTKESLTRVVIGACMEVHSTLGRFFPEYSYQRALAIELEIRGIPFKRETEIEQYYKNQSIGYRKVDFLIAETIPLEIKAVPQLDANHLAQTINYIETTSNEFGLLINFGAKSLEFKRVYNNKLTRM